MHTMPMPKLLAWGGEHIEHETVLQAAKAARLPFVPSHVALMPDAHVGIGSTVGSVIPTEGKIVPAFAGVDLGCGVDAAETDLTAEDLPDGLRRQGVSLMSLIEEHIPAGVGKGFSDTRHFDASDHGPLGTLGTPQAQLTASQEKKLACQFGTLGSGNHFAEVCTDERGRVWTLLHSGSRGIGNQLATMHIAHARKICEGEHLEDRDLAFLTQGTPDFSAYVADMTWAQDYAAASRQQMSNALAAALFKIAGHGRVTRAVRCHHNYTALEVHGGRHLWVTRKGAISARKGELGVVPGSMATGTVIVRGLGNPLSYQSCSHGAGRRLSRSQARRDLSAASLGEAMTGKVWNSGDADSLVDEHPLAYKDLSMVMTAQADLCVPVHRLTAVLNYKGC